MTTQLTHSVRMFRGHDCTRFECLWDSASCRPGNGGSHGRHGLTMSFVVRGEHGAVVFTLYTGWLPQSPSERAWPWQQQPTSPMPTDLGYHARAPQYDGQEQSQESCRFLDGAPCYYDGSGLNAHDAFHTLVNGGEDELWRFMEQYYRCVYEGEAYPVTCEYPRKER